MYNDIWLQRYGALDSLLESLRYTVDIAKNIKDNFDRVEENVPQKFLGYADALIKYSQQLDSLWSLLYNDGEYSDALNAERPKLVLPPTITVDETGTPYYGEATSITAPVNVEDDSGIVDSGESQSPGVYQENDINIGWFGNLVNLLNNYVPETGQDWKTVWSLIREGMGIANNLPQRTVEENVLNRDLGFQSQYLPLAWEGSSDYYKGEPIPEFVERPDDAEVVTEVETRDLVHEQAFPYGNEQIVLKIYRNDFSTLLQVTIAPMSTQSSIKAYGFVGSAMTTLPDVTMFSNIAIPLLFRGKESFEYNSCHLIINSTSQSVLDLYFTDLPSDGTAEIAANTTYTVTRLISPEEEWSSMETEMANFVLSVKRSQGMALYGIEYSGGRTPPVPPGYQFLSNRNIASAVFDSVTARRFVLTREASRDPNPGTGLYITYDNFSSGIYNEIIADEFVLTKEKPHAPTEEAGDDGIYRTDNLSSGILPSIRANRFELTKEVTREPNEPLAVGGKPPGEYIEYMYVDFHKGQRCFSISEYTYGGAMPHYLAPKENVGILMDAYDVDPNDPDRVGDVDLLGVFNPDALVDAMGIYAYDGDRLYNGVRRMNHTFFSVHCEDEPLWYKDADRFVFSIHVKKGLAVASFKAKISDRRIWEDGTHKLITEGEMPRNLIPLSHTIIPVGKDSFLIAQSNGAVRLTTAKGEDILQNVAYTGCWMVSKTIGDPKGTIAPVANRLPSMSTLRKGIRDVNTTFMVKDEIYTYYDWPGITMNLFVQTGTTGNDVSYTYDLDNLLRPLIDPDGKAVDTNEGVIALGESGNRSKIRIKTSDGVLLKILKIHSAKVPDYPQYCTGKHTFYLSVSEYLWMRPRIKWVVSDIDLSLTAMKRLIEDWDGIRKSEYFEEIQSHRNNITRSIQYAEDVTKDFFFNGSENTNA